MILEIISTGEEVLSGQIVDTNAAWICAQLSEQGVEISRRLTIGDRWDDLVACFRERSTHADVILVTGGLGPTSDDLSSKAMAEAAGVAWRLFPEWWEELKRRFALYNRPLDPQNIQQANLPDSAIILDNPIGTACGFKVKLNRATFYFMPGVPSEMKRMFTDLVLPQVRASQGVKQNIEVKLFQTFGWSESALGRVLSTISLPSTISLGYRPRLPTVEVKMISRGASAADQEKVSDEIRRLIGDRLFSESNQTLSQRVHELMLERKKTLAIAESCTGGLLSAYVVENAGSSLYFDRGYVTYSYRSKTELLGVPEALLQEHGAVSIPVAVAMADQARKRAGTVFALSVSGIAGPDGGTAEKPIGTVAFALATPEKTFSQMLFLPPWGRQRIREISAIVALDMLRRYLLDLPVIATTDFARAAAKS